MNTNTIKELTTEELQAELNQRIENDISERNKKRKEYESLKKATIEELAPKAKELSDMIQEFKKKCFGDLGALFDLLKDYSKRHNDGKGNFQIENDNNKIKFSRQGKGKFDERSVQAEKHIFDFLKSKYDDDQDTKDLIMSLLERKNGALDIQLVQKLYSMEDRFDDANWREGIKLLKESYSYSFSKDYVIFSQKNDNHEWETINLNFSY
ncbi:hypothetical protein GCM10023210_31020 [Chryseobacterium ginsengisoli]|uniref:DUF3164 family protein n=1 Tax=Chryseobacterium ginsengisoli TaxID=363853 RepID=A0ABP9MHL9_9FLAO